MVASGKNTTRNTCNGKIMVLRHSFRNNEERTYFMDKFRESDFYRFQSDDEGDYKVENSDSDGLTESEFYEDENAADASVWSPAISEQTIRALYSIMNQNCPEITRGSLFSFMQLCSMGSPSNICMGCS
ncbi:hypothetical protein NL108_006819 [Boleophthalmus pectinirostris]|nr:hypothetical protein NL108_006819 [Boleophthalmus pectinirostris]